MNTRGTSDEQAQANLKRYEETREEKRLRRQQKQQEDNMTSNLPIQLLVKGIQPVEIFTGADEQDPVTWLQAIDELFDATKVDKSDRRRLLPMYFGEDVKKWYRSEEQNSEYDEFKRQFINTFTSSTHKLKISTKLMNRRQGNDESVQSYYYDILALCTRFNPDMQEDEKILYLLRGLKPSMQQQIIMSDPKRCKDLFEQAKRAEAAASIIQQPPTIIPSILRKQRRHFVEHPSIKTTDEMIIPIGQINMILIGAHHNNVPITTTTTTIVLVNFLNENQRN